MQQETFYQACLCRDQNSVKPSKKPGENILGKAIRTYSLELTIGSVEVALIHFFDDSSSSSEEKNAIVINVYQTCKDLIANMADLANVFDELGRSD